MALELSDIVAALKEADDRVKRLEDRIEELSEEAWARERHIRKLEAQLKACTYKEKLNDESEPSKVTRIPNEARSS